MTVSSNALYVVFFLPASCFMTEVFLLLDVSVASVSPKLTEILGVRHRTVTISLLSVKVEPQARSAPRMLRPPISLPYLLSFMLNPLQSN